VIGANGAGKSTLINTVSRLLPIRGGSVRFEGRDLAGLTAPQVVDLGMVQVPEGRQLFGPLTVRENLLLGFQRIRSRGKAALQERLDFVHGLFPILHERAQQMAVTLSGGEQQMVAIARALMADPQLLLLDEPSLGLAPLVIDRIFEVLQGLREGGLTMLLVEQRAEAALDLADYAYVRFFVRHARALAVGIPAAVVILGVIAFAAGLSGWLLLASIVVAAILFPLLRLLGELVALIADTLLPQ
jgi:branched-chain amino acid transport system ATP-binding protein